MSWNWPNRTPGTWIDPKINDLLIDDKGKEFRVMRLEENGLVIRLAWKKAGWTQYYGAWVRRTSLNAIDWKLCLYGNSTSVRSLLMKRRPILNGLQGKIKEAKEVPVVPVAEVVVPKGFFHRKRMIQI